MRFYPLGSSSLNILYYIDKIPTASFTPYAITASAAIRVVSASYALSGSNGIPGVDGQCVYLPGPQGPSGSQGPQGPDGGVSFPVPEP